MPNLEGRFIANQIVHRSRQLGGIRIRLVCFEAQIFDHIVSTSL